MDLEASPSCFPELLHHFQRRDRHSTLDSIRLCGRYKDLHNGRLLHASIVQKDMIPGDVWLHNAIISMYAKCGALVDAKKVFDEVPIRTVVTWNALLAGYVQHERADEALELFRQMQKEGFCPDAVTYVCIANVCGQLGFLEMGEDIHDNISKEGLLETNIVVGNALIDMYVKCSRLEKAQRVFVNLLARNVVSYNSLITGYSRHDVGEEALICYRQMQDEGISPDVVTFVGMLKACGNIGCLKVGEEIHAKFNKQCLSEENVAFGNALIDMYAKCGMMNKAQMVFDELVERNVVSWNVMMMRYSQSGLDDEALSCFRRMQCEGISPNAITFVCILKVCGSIGALEIGEEICFSIHEQGLLEADIILGTALVDMFAKCGKLKRAQAIFDKLPGHDVASWGALISGYAQHGFAYKALGCFKKMRDEGVSPDAITFISILKACGSSRSLEIGGKIHAQVRCQGLLDKDVNLGNALIDMYAKCGALQKAQGVFWSLPVHDVTSWNSLITGFVVYGANNEALNCFMKMEDDGISPDVVSFLCALKACCNLGSPKVGEKIHHEIQKQDLGKNNIVLGTALIDMYAKCKMLWKAQEVFDELSVRDASSWNALIAGYVQHGHGDKALSCYKRMQDEGHISDAVTFVCVSNACGSMGSLAIGEKIHIEVSRQGLLQNDVVLGTAIVDMYAKCGVLRKAQEVFEGLPERNIQSWNALLTGYAQLGHTDYVSRLLREMIANGITPDLITFLILLNACNHAGLLEDGLMIFNEMNVFYRLSPTYKHYSCIIDLASHAGHFDKALSFIENVPSSNRFPLWLALLGGCQKFGNVELGRWAFEQWQQLEGDCAAAYVCMGNIYGGTCIYEEEGNGNLKALEK